MEFSGWTPWDVAGQARSADLKPLPGAWHAEGLHLGRIIHTAKVAAGESVSEIEGDQPGVRMQEGFLWESAVEYMIAGASMDEAIDLAFKRYVCSLRAGITTQLHLERDGVRLTPDALDGTLGRGESYKATRRSLRKARSKEDFEANFWTWVMQEKACCLLMGVDEVRWIVWWVAGDYSKGKGTGPVVAEATARFTRGELDANWADVLRIAATLRARGEGACA